MGSRLLQRVDASRRFLWLAAFVPLAGLYLATLRTPTGIANFDPAAVGPSAWALAHHGTPAIDAAQWPSLNQWFLRLSGGSVVSNREPGLILLAAPFYAAMPWAGPQDQMPSAIAAALSTAAAMATLALVVRRIAPGRAALATVLIGGVATTTWTVSGTSLWPHGPGQLFLVLGVLATATESYLPAGVAFAAATLVRPPLAIVAAVTGVWESVRRRSVRPALLIGAVTAAGVGWLLAYSARYWHGGLDSQYTAVGPGFVRPFLDVRPGAWLDLLVNVFGTLGSVGHGILLTSPFLIPLTPGLRPAWRVAPSWARTATIGGLIYLFVQLKANRFNGGEGFWGYRYPLPMLTLAAPLLYLSWRAYIAPNLRRQAAFVALVVVSVTCEAIGATCFSAPDYYQNSPGLWRDMAWLPANLNGVMTGPHSVRAMCLLLAGLLAAGLAYRAVLRRGRSSAGPDVLDVAGRDRLPLASDVEDQPARGIDVDRRAGEGVADGRDDDLAPEGGARRAVRRRQAARLGITLHVEPLRVAGVEPPEDRDE